MEPNAQTPPSIPFVVHFTVTRRDGTQRTSDLGSITSKSGSAYRGGAGTGSYRPSGGGFRGGGGGFRGGGFRGGGRR